jgi:hypothetical protein
LTVKGLDSQCRAHRCQLALCGSVGQGAVEACWDDDVRVWGSGFWFRLRFRSLSSELGFGVYGLRVHGAEFGVWSLGFGVWGLEFRVQGVGYRVWGTGCRVQGSGFRVQGSGFRVQGSGFRVQGSGFRVAECRDQGRRVVGTSGG